MRFGKASVLPHIFHWVHQCTNCWIRHAKFSAQQNELSTRWTRHTKFSAQQNELSARWTRSGVLRTQKLKTLRLKTESSKFSFLKSEAGPYNYSHARPTARYFFLANLYLPGPFICISPRPLLSFPLLVVAAAFSCVGPYNTKSHPARLWRQLVPVSWWVPAGCT